MRTRALYNACIASGVALMAAGQNTSEVGLLGCFLLSIGGTVAIIIGLDGREGK